MFICGLNQVRNGGFQGVVRTQNININHRLESVDGKLVDRSEEVPGGTSAEQR